VTPARRCPRCGRVRPAREFYRRQRTRLSSYCRSCQRAAAHLARTRRRQDPTAVEELRAVDQAHQRRYRTLGGKDPAGGDTA
jgi:hypothetical protein